MTVLKHPKCLDFQEALHGSGMIILLQNYMLNKFSFITLCKILTLTKDIKPKQSFKTISIKSFLA